MWEHGILGTDLYHLVNWFFVYSILGWLVESIYMSLCNRKITNRGFIKGPICPIYGFGALGVYFVLKPLEGNYVALYFFGAVLATTFEFLTAKLMLHLFGEVWWDYHNKPFNYKGIICLESTIAWGFYTIIMFGFLQKMVVRIVEAYPRRFGTLFGGFLLIYYTISCVQTILKQGMAGEEFEDSPVLEGNMNLEEAEEGLAARIRNYWNR